MTSSEILAVVAQVKRDGGPRLRRIIMSPRDFRALAILVSGPGADEPRFPFWALDSVDVLSDPWCPDGRPWFDPPEAVAFFRCTEHEDCASLPELGRACYLDRLARLRSTSARPTDE